MAQKKEPSRREFIKTLAGLGLGAAMAQTLYSSLNPKQRAQLVAWAQSYGKPMTYAELGRLIDAAAWDDVVRAVRYQPYSYIIYQAPDGSYQAKNGNTGQIEFSGTDFATMMMQVIDATRTSKISPQAMCKILIKSPGASGSPYIINRTISARWLGGVIIEGETFGNPPFLKLANGVNAPMFQISGRGVILRNLYLDGNSAGNTSQNTHGIEILNQPDGTSSDSCIVEDCSINFFSGTGVYMHDYVYASGVRNCVINTCNRGIHFNNLPDRNFILGNTVLTPAFVGMDLGILTYVRVEANAILGSTSLSYADINLNGVGSCSIVGNIIYHDAGYGITLTNSSNNAIVGNTFTSEVMPAGLTGIIGNSTYPPNNNLIAGNSFRVGYPIPIDYSAIPNTNMIVNNMGFNPRGFAITTPAMPASGTAQSNTFPFPVIVYLYGGTVTQIQINGQVVFSSGTGISLTGQSFTLNPGDTIAITYTAAPTWKWYGL